MILPSVLSPGDAIGIVAPASNVKPEMLAAGVAELERLGFRPRYRDDIFAKDRYTAGSVERRADELMEMWSAPDVKAVIAARGGYGCMPLLRRLDPVVFRDNPKIFIGYSDITALQLFLWKECRLVTFHGPMVAKDFAGGPEHYDWDSFHRLVGNVEPAGILRSPETRTVRGGVATGRLVGGCLTLLGAMAGTPWQLDGRDAILFFEDTMTKPYQLDRLLRQLELAGNLDGLRGVIIGEMVGCRQSADQGYDLDDVFRDFFASYDVPVVAGWRSGHGEVGNLTLPLGVPIRLDADVQTVEVLAPTVFPDTP